MTASHKDPRIVRLAGALYLVIILCGLTAELVLRGPLLEGSPTRSPVRYVPLSGNCVSVLLPTR